MFILIGLGLGDVEDITVKGLNYVKGAARVYLESYTSILMYGLDKSELEKFYGRPILDADRRMVEQNSDELLDGADRENIVLLVVGDPFGATTHADLTLRARERHIPVKVVHNASIINAVGCCGLQLYRFGEVVSLCMWTESWTPDSFFEKIVGNFERGLHTLCLLDIKTKEQSIENMMKGLAIYEPPRYQSCADAAKQLIEIMKKRVEMGNPAPITPQTMVIGMARVGWDEKQKIVYCPLEELVDVDMGEPLHSLVIPGELHPIEQDMVNTFRIAIQR